MVLRIPADWVYQPMRCKHCQQIFQARQNPAVAPSPAKTPMPARVVAPVAITPKAPAAPPVARPAAATPAAAPVKAMPAARPAQQPRRGRWWKGGIIAVGVLAIAGVLAVVVGPEIARQFSANKPPPKDEPKVADLGNPSPKIDSAEPKSDNPPPKIDPKQIDDPPPPKIDKTKPKKDDGPPAIDTPPPKIDSGKPVVTPKEDPPLKKETPVVKSSPNDPYPRRALFISVNDYLLANPLNFGRDPRPAQGGKQQAPAFPGSNTTTLRDLFAKTLHFPKAQLVHLSDAGPDAHAPLKPVIERTITDFLKTSRAQDRIVILFAGHIMEDEKEAFLVPLDGDLSDPKTLIPLTWLYDRLAECKARQKVLILDICRLDPARGNERPGGDPMDKLLDTKLKAAPDGVQVLSACILEQQSYEFENGGIFLQALCAAQQDLLQAVQAGLILQEQGAALPLEEMTKIVNSHLTRLLALHPQKLTQTARLTGKEKAGGAPPNPEEPPAQVVTIQPPPPPDGNAAKREVVEAILEEMNKLPPTRISRSGAKDAKLALHQLPAFPAKVLEQYRPDYESFTDLAFDLEKYPLRKAVLAAAGSLRAVKDRFAMRETLFETTNAQFKNTIKTEQAAPGKAELILKDALAELKEAGKKRSEEKSKRWQAHYDYVLACLLARLVYVTEYNFALAQIRTESLPEKTDGATGFRLGATKTVNVKENFARDWAKEMRKTWDKLINEHPQTPWAVIAQRERLTALGLEWRLARR